MMSPMSQGGFGILILIFYGVMGYGITNATGFAALIFGILSFASYRSLAEKSYTGVMASTGLSYLSLIVSLGASGGLLLLS